MRISMERRSLIAIISDTFEFEKGKSDMNFDRIQEKKLKYEQNKHKISAVTLSSYEKDFELTFTHNSTAIDGNTLTLMETKVALKME